MRNLILISSFLLLSANLFAQNTGSLKGMVTDESMNNEPLLLANVQLKGKQLVSQTNFHGNFEISDLEAGNYTVVVSYLGYETKEIPVTIKKNTTAEIKAILNPLEFNFDAIKDAMEEGAKVSLTSRQE